QVLQNAPDGLRCSTHRRARRGRGILFATTPFVVLLLVVSGLFALSVRDLSLWQKVKEVSAWGTVAAAALGAFCFALGFRIRDDLTANASGIWLRSHPALGPTRTLHLSRAGLSAIAVDASLRSLGADVLLVAVQSDGRRIPLAEGDAHSGQIPAFAERL